MEVARKAIGIADPPAGGGTIVMRKALSIAFVSGALIGGMADPAGQASATVDTSAPVVVKNAYAEAARTMRALDKFGLADELKNGGCFAKIDENLETASAAFRKIGVTPGDLAHKWVIRHRIARCGMSEPYATLFVGASAVESGEALDIAAPINVVNAALENEGRAHTISYGAIKKLSGTVKATDGTFMSALRVAFEIGDDKAFKVRNRSANRLVKDAFADFDPFEPGPRRLHAGFVRPERQPTFLPDVPSYGAFK